MVRRVLSGRCTCGQVCYEVADAFQYAACCHCSRCRRATGSAFKPFGGIERENFAVSKGARFLKLIGGPDAHDARCAACGSLLYSLVRDGRYVHVALGTLTDDPGLKPTEHIYVGDPEWEPPKYALTGSPAKIASSLNEYGAMGVSHLQLRFAARSLEELCDQMARFGAEVGPDLTR